MSKTAVTGLLAGIVLALSPVVPALADPDDDSGKGDNGGGAYPCANGQFWYPQYNQCVLMCKPGFDHINSPDACDKIPVAYLVRQRADAPSQV